MNAPNIIGIAGQAGAGKSTAAKFFMEHGYAHGSFAEPLKQMLNDAFGWTMSDWEDRKWKEDSLNAQTWASNGWPAMTRSPRFLAQWLGTDVVRNNFGEDAWLKIFKERWVARGMPKTVIADIRFQNEVDMVNKLGGTVIRITRRGEAESKTHFFDDGDVALAPHASEQTADLRGIAATIHNDGTIEELYEKLAARFTTGRAP